MVSNDSFPAKVMLFGEYSILLGSQAVSVPFPRFSACLKMPSGKPGMEITDHRESNRLLKALLDHYLDEREFFTGILDLGTFKDDIREGLYLESTIPQKYGTGSSGALCAAVYHRYAKVPADPDNPLSSDDLVRLKCVFIRMESWFHGRSSGFDPLVSYLRHPLKMERSGIPSVVAIPEGFYRESALFLLDSGRPAGTAPLVRSFLDRYMPQGKVNAEGKIFCNLTDSCIAGMLDNKADTFHNVLASLSGFQLEKMNPMIPAAVRRIWADGLGKELFHLKLCGSGGGGFLTGFTTDWEKTVKYFDREDFRVLRMI